MEENPAVIGPSDTAAFYSCVGCFRGLKNVRFFCPRCHLPACRTFCSGLRDPAGHALECDLLHNKVVPLSYHAWPGIAFLLRCLLLRKANPAMWQLIEEQAPFAAMKRVEK